MTTISISAKPIKRERENLAGSEGTGSNGAVNRVYTLSTTSDITIKEVYLDGVLLIEDTDYSVDNTNKQITVLINAFDRQTLSTIYEV